MNYHECLDWLFGIRRFGQERTLDPIIRLSGLLGDPHRRFKAVHVTGTNGKGSTSAMIASILQAEGHRVGLFTSPHLERFTERIQVDGEEIPDADVVRLVNEVRPIVEELHRGPEVARPLFFDIVTALAFEHYRERSVDYAVLEVGMGGRLDATNVVDPEVSVITNVSLEHTEVLGDTVAKIAWEKAGIVKPGRPAVTASRDPEALAVIRARCRDLGSRLVHVGADVTFTEPEATLIAQRFTVNGLHGGYPVETPLLGAHQRLNAACAVAAAELMQESGNRVSREAILRGLRSVSWPGRMEVAQTRPLVVLDGAKDVEAAKALAEAVRSLPHRRLIAVVSISGDKNIPQMVAALAPVADRFVVTTHGVMGRAADPSIITRELDRHRRPWVVAATTSEALDEALREAAPDDMVLVAGSVFLVGEARRRWRRS